MSNKYTIHSRISNKKFRQIVKYYSLDIEADKIAERNSINKILKAIRHRIAEVGETEIDESC